MKCPKCSNRMSHIEHFLHIPSHYSCRNCGTYVEAEPVVVMPDIPPVGQRKHYLTDEAREHQRSIWRKSKAKSKGSRPAQGKQATV